MQVLDKGYIELEDYMGNDNTIVCAARVSTLKKSKGAESDAKLIKYLLKNSHLTPFEMVAFQFRVKAPIFVARQWFRHRAACLSGDTIVTFNKHSKWKKGYHSALSSYSKNGFMLKELFKRWELNSYSRNKIKSLLLRVFDETTRKFTVGHISNITYSGPKEVFEIKTESGKYITSSKDHLFLTSRGWSRLEDAIGLTVSKNKTAGMTKECFIISNGEPVLWRSYDWMKSQRENGASVSEIAEAAGCSYHNIRKWLKIHNLKFNHLDNLTTLCVKCHFEIHRDKEMRMTKKGTPLAGKSDKVISVKYKGIEDTYDITVEGDNHNFVANGLVAHNSFSEQSRRYTDEDIEFHIPKTLRYQSTDNKQMSAGEFDIVKAEPLIDSIWKISDEAYRIYLMLLDNGVAREQARMVLPVNLYTSFYFKMDLRNLFHFLELRDHPHAQEEIRLYAQQIKKLIQPIVPVSYAAWEELNQSK